MEQNEDFVNLIRENDGILFKISKLYAAEVEDQKDLYQEIVYQLWKSYPSFKALSKISTWVYKVALNTALAHRNSRKKKKQQQSAFQLEWQHYWESRDEIQEARVAALYHHIRQLNIVEKGLILLYLEGKNYEEIAEITGFTPTNVGTKLSRIKQKLKSQIQKSATWK